MTRIEMNPELFSDGSPAPGEVAPIWEDFSLADFVENGLLYEVNRRVLWDLGLALAVEVEGLPTARRYLRLMVQQTTPPTRIIDNPALEVTRWQRLQRWLSTRIGQVAP